MRPLLRSSAIGALLGGVFFLGLGMYMNRAIGAGPLEHLGPLGFTVVVGATIGGLVAPLFRWRRGRGLVDTGLTHVALPEMEIAWLSDRTRPFVVVLMEASRVDRPLGPFAHLGVACSTRAELEKRCALASAEGRLREPLRETGGPAGCLAMLSDPDGHTLELSYGQEVGIAVESRNEGDA
jgi:hypothetical protein